MSGKTLASEEYFALANAYLDAYSRISKELQDPSTHLSDEQLSTLYYQSKPLMQIAYEFQKMGFAKLESSLGSSVKTLKDAVEEASSAIQNIQFTGKVIEIITDLVAIGVIIAVPAPKITSLTMVPALVKELIDDVAAL